MFKFDKNSSINQGRFRLRKPKEFKRFWIRKDSRFRGISYVQGILKNGDFSIQSIRFDRNLWTEKKAASWWKKYKKKFEKYLKLRKNPIEGYNETITYIELLVGAFDTIDLIDLSNALIYYIQGFTCTDCDKNFYACKCEYCEDCLQNKCVCKYDIQNSRNIRQEIINIAKNTLNKQNYLLFLDRLSEIINDDTYLSKFKT